LPTEKTGTLLLNFTLLRHTYHINHETRGGVSMLHKETIVSVTTECPVKEFCESCNAKIWLLLWAVGY